MVITGLTKAKLGDTFAGLKNVTLATSNGLVYSYGQNLQPKPHYKRTKLHHLATAAAAAANASANNGTAANSGTGPSPSTTDSPLLPEGEFPQMDGANAGTNASLAYITGGNSILCLLSCLHVLCMYSAIL